jgi:hypothetical protein
MRGKAMSDIVSHLESNGIDFSKLKALEFFARKGDWHTQSYCNKVASINAWEIDKVFEEELKKNLSMATVAIGDSFTLAKEDKYEHLFDFIVFDNPQGVYGEYCEHFECIDFVPHLIKKQGGLVVFNINRTPFNYDKDSIWGKRRAEYYGQDASDLKAGFLLNFYEHKFSCLGFNTEFSFEKKRNEEYLSYLIFYLRIKSY